MIHTLALLLLGAGGGDLQDKKPKVPKGEWDWEWRARAELAYNSNVWQLDGGQQDRLEDPDAAQESADATSSRFDDIETVDDFVFVPNMRYEARGPSPFGRRFGVWAELSYSQYFQNPTRSHFEAGLGLHQSMSSNGRLELGFNFIPEYFRRNYVADAVDANFNGNISADERRYEDATYREFEVLLEYRHDLVKRTGQGSFGLEGSVALGYRDRSYDSPWSGRDGQTPLFALGLKFEHGPALRWGIRYTYEASDSPTKTELVLVNEIALGQDVNGDGDMNNRNAPTVTTVDRTYTEHGIEIFVGYEISPKLEVGLVYERTTQDYASDEPFDFDHRDREDTRDEIELDLRYKFSKTWDLGLGYEGRSVHTDRSEDPEASGEAIGYKRHIFFAQVSYHW